MNTKANVFNMTEQAQAFGRNDASRKIIRASIIEYVKANPKDKQGEFANDFKAGYIAGTLNVKIEYARTILVKAGIDTAKADKRTKAEHDAWNASKVAWSSIVRDAGHTDKEKSENAKKGQAHKKGLSADSEPAKVKKASIPVYGDVEAMGKDVAQYASAMLMLSNKNAKLASPLHAIIKTFHTEVMKAIKE